MIRGHIFVFRFCVYYHQITVFQRTFTDFPHYLPRYLKRPDTFYSHMKQLALLFICFSLLLVACNTENVKDDTPSTTSANTTSDVIAMPQVEDEVLVIENDTTDVIVLGDDENNAFIEWEQTPSEDITFTITAIATRAGRDKYALNQFIVETNAEIDETVYIEVKLNDGFALYDLNSNLDCDNTLDVITARNQYYGMKEINGTKQLCFSPPRDMYEYNVMEITIQNTYDEVLLNESLEAPRLLRSTQIVPLYKNE